MESDLERFVALVRRELGAREVQVGAPPADGALDSDAERTLSAPMPDGRVVVARFDAALGDREAKQRRLEMLASTFDTVEDPQAHRARPSPARALHEELLGLCERAKALNALVVDANSPILWAAARPRDVVPEAWNPAFPGDEAAPAEGAPAEAAPPEAAPPDDPANSVASQSRDAIRALRDGLDLGALRRGKRVRHIERDGPAPYLAHSFAGIYLLTLVFDEAFDELRAERAVLEALPRVERFVLALPPLDPTPERGAGVIAIRRARRR